MNRIKPLIAAALALGGTAIVPAAQAQRYWEGSRYEQPYRGGYGHSGQYRDAYDGGGYDRAYRGDYRDAYYPRYDQPYRRCSSGTTGAVVGALAGGLLGHAVAGRGDHALGTILGAGAGALAGRAVERSDNSGFCR